MDRFQQLDHEGRLLLADLARDPESDCWRQFDALFYATVWRHLRDSASVLGVRVARYLKVEGVVAPDVARREVDEVAHEATKIALRRVRENAARFDPARGTPTMWVIGAAEFAYVEVAKSIGRARARQDLLPPDELATLVGEAPSTEEHVIRRTEDLAAYAAAAEHLSEKEFVALTLVATLGYSYAEVAEKLFGDRSMTKQVDGLLTRAKRKLSAAWEDRRPRPSGAAGTNLSRRADDMGRSDG